MGSKNKTAVRNKSKMTKKHMRNKSKMTKKDINKKRNRSVKIGGATRAIVDGAGAASHSKPPGTAATSHSQPRRWRMAFSRNKNNNPKNLDTQVKEVAEILRENITTLQNIIPKVKKIFKRINEQNTLSSETTVGEKVELQRGALELIADKMKKLVESNDLKNVKNFIEINKKNINIAHTYQIRSTEGNKKDKGAEDKPVSRGNILHIAVFNRVDYRIVRLLINSAKNYDVLNDSLNSNNHQSGKTPLEFAKSPARPRYVKALEEAAKVLEEQGREKINKKLADFDKASVDERERIRQSKEPAPLVSFL